MRVGLLIAAAACLVAAHLVERRGVRRGRNFSHTVRLLLGLTTLLSVVSVFV